MNAAPCEICGRVNKIVAPRSRDSMNLFARMVRALLRPLGRFVHALTFIFCGFALWAMALRWILPFFGIVQNGLLLSGLILGAIWTIRFATRASVWLFAPATRQVKRPGGRGFWVLPICGALLTALNALDMPLRVGFWLSQPELEKLAQAEIRKPSKIKTFTPRRVGLYRAKQVDVSRQSVRIEVIDNDFLWSGTRAGFAKCPQGCEVAKFPPVYMRSYEKQKNIRLWENWYWWSETGTND